MDLINRLQLLSIKNEDPDYGQKVFALLNDPEFEVIDLSLRPYSKSILHYLMYDSCKESLLYLIELSREPTKSKQVINLDINVRETTTEKSPLHVAVYNKAHECVKILLDMGADPNQADFLGCAPLYAAVINSDLILTDLLIKKGAELNHRHARGRTLLHIAAIDDNQEIMKILLLNGADQCAIDSYGLTAEDLAKGKISRELKIKWL